MGRVTFSASYSRAASRWPRGTERMEFDTSWGTTHLLAAGPAGAPTVVLLHGDGATATAWAELAAELAPGHRVVAPDQPGNPGRSVASRPFRSTADQVSWVGELLGALASPPVHLVGHSAGAHLALSSALAGHRVASLSLLDPTFCFAGLRASYLARALPMLLRPTPERVRRFMTWETGGRRLDAAWLDAYVRGATGFARTPIVRTRRPGRRELARLAVPTLVVVAGASRAHDPQRLLRAARESSPAVAVATVPAATHHTVPVLDAPEIAGLVAAHVTANPSTA